MTNFTGPALGIGGGFLLIVIGAILHILDVFAGLKVFLIGFGALMVVGGFALSLFWALRK